MERTVPHVMSTSELAPVNGSGATPFSQQTVVLTKQAYIQLKWEAHYWRRQHERLLEREAALKAEVEAHQATIRDLQQRLYGTKSEQSRGPDGAGVSRVASPRKRGQQPGSPGHGRSDRAALPVVAEVRDVLPGMNAGASPYAVPLPIEGSGTAWVLLGSWALSPARPTPIHPRHECRGFSALLMT